MLLYIGTVIPDVAADAVAVAVAVAADIGDAIHLQMLLRTPIHMQLQLRTLSLYLYVGSTVAVVRWVNAVSINGGLFTRTIRSKC